MSKTTPEEAYILSRKHGFDLRGQDLIQLATLIDEVRGVDAESVGNVTITKGVGVFEKIQFQLTRGLPAGTHQIYTHPAPSKPARCPICHEERAHTGTCGSNDPRALCNQAPSQPVATTDLAAETPMQKGMRATLAVQGLSKAFDGLGAGRKDRKMKVTDEMVSRFLMWRLPAEFSPDCGISFKPESDYEHPVYGRSKHEPMGTNLLNADQARAMLEHVLTDIQPAAPASTWQDLEAEQPAAPVELPVVAWFADDGDSQGLALKENAALRNCEPGTVAEALVKLSDAQAAIAAGRKAS